MIKKIYPKFPGAIVVLASIAILTGCTARGSIVGVNDGKEVSRGNMPKLYTNEEFIDEVRSESFDLDDIESMFSYVFGSLNNTVNVYPTENYYYFHFYANGGDIWGNIRLDSIDRKEGIISFAYFRVTNRREPYFEYRESWHKNLSDEDGVILKKIDDLEYTVTYKDKTVTFLLHNVSQTEPVDMRMHEGEIFVVRTFDESGFQLVLLFDETQSRFRFVLDESAPLPDLLQPYGKDIYVGRRSGFAFYDEPGMGRKILFGVDKMNVRQNNYYDGPFDQLADNFVDPEEFEQYIIRVYPTLEGKVRGRGDFLDESGNRKPSRVLISPYITYSQMVDIWGHVAACQKKFKDQQELTGCITKDPKND
ncbi:hypothetical protein KKC44_03305 [Patescibacteria group bacterium]|nr:hypothetical protein [Patescibacteria group bacterium]